jgi:hypothetical protein
MNPLVITTATLTTAGGLMLLWRLLTGSEEEQVLMVGYAAAIAMYCAAYRLLQLLFAT